MVQRISTRASGARDLGSIPGRGARAVGSAGRALPPHGRGRRFDPCTAHARTGRLAQLEERLPYKQEVEGSSPSSPIPWCNTGVGQKTLEGLLPPVRTSVIWPRRLMEKDTWLRTRSLEVQVLPGSRHGRPDGRGTRSRAEQVRVRLPPVAPQATLGQRGGRHLGPPHKRPQAGSTPAAAMSFVREVAQPGSALDWGSRGRRFKSGLPDCLLVAAAPPALRSGWRRSLAV